MDLHDEIVNDIDEAINDIFLKYQERFDIKSGDISVGLALDLEDCEEQMAQIMVKVLDYERS